MSVRLLIAGAGGHAREIAALLEDINRAAASAPWLLAAFVVDPGHAEAGMLGGVALRVGLIGRALAAAAALIL